MQKLQTVNAVTLLYEPLEKPSFVVDSLIPTGLSLFCGSQKIGKGITLNADEAAALLEALQKEVNSGD